MKKLVMIAALAAAGAGGGYVMLGSDGPGKTVGPGETIAEAVGMASHSDHLALIPADTLFYMGGLKPVAAKDMMASMASVYQLLDPKMLHGINQQVMDDLFGKAETPGAKMAVSLFDFFIEGLADLQGMFSETGAKDTLFSSIYTVGLMPVLRYEADKERFDRFITKLEARAGVTAVIRETAGLNYRSYALTAEEQRNLELVIAYHNGDAIFTIAIAPGASSQNLAIALGQARPANSLREAGTVVQIKNDYDYLPDSLGYISFKELIAALTSSDNLAGQAVTVLDDGSSAWLNQLRSPVCAAEFAGIAEVWPRMVSGYRSMDFSATGFSGEFHMNMEINHLPLTATLQKIRGHIPGDLASGTPQVLSLALGLDISRVNEVLGELAGHAQALQYECELLQSLNGIDESINQARPMVAMSTGMASGLKGLRLSLFDIDGDVAAGQITRVDGMVTLSGEQIPALVNMMMAMGGGAGMVTIPADGTPVALPLPPELRQKTTAEVQPMVAMKSNQAVLYAGEMAAAQSQQVLDETLNDDGLLFFSMDYGKYMKLLSGVMDTSLATAELNEQEKAQFASFSEAMKNIDYQEQVKMEFTARGIEFSGKLEIHNP